MKISIITVCFNSETTIEKTIKSVIDQFDADIEYIIIDGASTDSTLDIINKYTSHISKVISEKDLGLYDAMNKGINISTGDIIGILNSDDIFYDNYVIKSVCDYFNESIKIDAIIGDVVFFNKLNENKIVRHYSVKYWTPFYFYFGILPPHPSFFCKKEMYIKYGLYNLKFKISSDFDLLLRFIKINKINFKKTNLITTKMQLGGLSTNGFKNLNKMNNEVYVSLKSNKMFASHILIYFKYIIKITQLINFQKYDRKENIL